MSGRDLDALPGLGFFGKLPINGDFIQRDLPVHFVHRWDQWLQDNLAYSQQQLENNWLKYYLTSPVWRFFIAPTLIDEHAYIGILGPSVDSVGRYFPMTIAAAVKRELVPSLFSRAFQGIYSDLEDVFLNYLNNTQEGNNLNVETLISELSEHSASLRQLLQKQQIDRFPESLDSHRFVLSDQSELSGAVSGLWLMQLMEQHRGASLWWSNGSHAFEPSLLVNRGLPDRQQFVAMLSGFDNTPHWRQKQLLMTLPEKTPADVPGQAIEPPAEHAEPSFSEARNAVANQPEDTSDEPEDVSHFLLVDNDAPPVLPEFCSDTGASDKQLLDQFLSDAPDKVSTQTTDSSTEDTNDKLSATPVLSPCSAGFSETGKLRSENQDAILIHSKQSMWVVADGMGGHTEGDKASQAIVTQLEALDLQGDLFANMEQISQILNQVNQTILDFARSNETTCGSTVVILLKNENQCGFMWAGDSRLYLSRNGQLQQLTRDHTAENGLIRRSNAITRAVGVYEHLDIECGYHQLLAGDRFLLCSDGVYDTLSDTEISDTLRIGSPQEAGLYLKNRVLEGEARDNLSGILVWFQEAAS